VVRRSPVRRNAERYGLPSCDCLYRARVLPGVFHSPRPIAFCWSSNARSNPGICVFHLSIFTLTFSISSPSTTQPTSCVLIPIRPSLTQAHPTPACDCLVVSSDVGCRVFALYHRIYHHSYSTTVTRRYSLLWPQTASTLSLVLPPMANDDQVDSSDVSFPSKSEALLPFGADFLISSSLLSIVLQWLLQWPSDTRRITATSGDDKSRM